MNLIHKHIRLITVLMGLIMVTGCANSDTTSVNTNSSSKEKIEQVKIDKKEQELKASEEKEKQAKEEKAAKAKKEAEVKAKKEEEQKKLAAEKVAKEAEEKKKSEEKKARLLAASKKNYDDLANMEYSGTQTIDINGGEPYFTEDELSIQNGAWETYGNLDSMNRATAANAILNQSLIPTGERGDISSVTPTGWKNKKIKSGYLYNRSHLIGWALAGENANLKNLITGTRQLNSPEMLRFEMDVKHYLEQSSDNYVRYRITPIFRGNELLARGVQMEAQSIGSDAIKFNVYIFNVQDGVELNYTDGSSVVSGEQRSEAEVAAEQQQKQQEAATATQQQDTVTAQETPQAASGEYVDANGQGLIKGSKNGIYHVPGSQYYNRTTKPVAMFKTIAEAEAAGYRAPK